MKHRMRGPVSLRLLHFPENQLGASLKHLVVQDALAGRPHFPENQLGASLKRRAGLRPALIFNLLPREPTRGLIEARAV